MPLSNKIAVSCILLLGVLLVISISEKQESHNLQSRRSRYRKISNVLQDWPWYGLVLSWHFAKIDSYKQKFILATWILQVRAHTNSSWRPLSRTNSAMSDVLTPALYWPMVEASLGVVGACLPSMRPFYKKYASRSSLQSLRNRIQLRSYFTKLSNSSSGYSQHVDKEIDLSSGHFQTTRTLGPKE